MKKLLLVSAAIVALAPSVSFAAFDASTMTCAAGECALALNAAIAAATTQSEIQAIVNYALTAGLSAGDLAAVLAAALAVVPATSPVAAMINEQVAALNLTLPAVASAANPITAS